VSALRACETAISDDQRAMPRSQTPMAADLCHWHKSAGVRARQTRAVPGV